MSALFEILAAVLILDLIVDLGVEALNLRQKRDEPPTELASLLSLDRYRTSVEYLREKTFFGAIRRVVFLAALLGFIALGGLEAVDQFARALASGEILTGLIFFGALTALQWALQLPFTLQSTFGTEARFGFNRTTPRTFASDQVKGAILLALLGAPALAGVIYAFSAWGDRAWLYAWIGLTVFQLFLAFVAPAWILPLFNRFSPLPAGPLRSRIEAFAREQGFGLAGISTMDGSKRSSKANAFFTGFGRTRRLVFFDTLLEKHTDDEIVAVLAHEIGHARLGHIPRMLMLSIASQGLLFLVIGKLMGAPALLEAFRVTTPSVHASLCFAMILYTPISRVIGLVSLALSRRHEFEADRFAAGTTGRSEDLVAALRKLSAENLSDLVPHPLKVKLEYSHPPVLARIQALRAASSRR